MPEPVKFDGSIFGYDKLIIEDNSFVALQGEGKSELHIGMKIVLVGDTQGYVSPSFTPGEMAIIIRFREPYKDGSSDRIILVSNDKDENWVKPSNIQNNDG